LPVKTGGNKPTYRETERFEDNDMMNITFLKNWLTGHLTFLALPACLLAISVVPFSTVIAQVLASAATETSVTLTWTAPGDDGSAGRASSYDLRYGTQPLTDANWGAATLVTGEPGPRLAGQTEVFTVQNLPPNFTYCFALKAGDEVPNWSELSNSLTVILPPTPVSATIDTAGGSASLTCAQVTSYFTLVYQFALDTTSDFNSPTIRPGGISGSTVTAQYTGLESGQSYYWRCRALAADLSDTSSWSSFRVISSSNRPPGEPGISTPANGSTITTTPVTLVVNNAIDPDGDPLTYYFQLYNQAGDSLLSEASGVAEGLTQTAWTAPVALSDSTTYQWRARCFDGSEYSAWTSYSQFSTDLGQILNQPPSLPTHLLPGDGDTIVAAPIVVLIENAVDPDGDPLWYDFWIYSDPSLTQLVDSRLGVSQTPNQTAATFTFTPVIGQRYWWRVQVTDGTNTVGPTTATWFEYWELVTGGNAFTAGAVGPGSGAVILTSRPTLTAANITAENGNSYYFEVATDSNFLSPVAASSGITEKEGGITGWKVDENLESGREYFWRVRAGTYPYSTVANFYVDVAVFAAPNPVHLGDLATFHLPDSPVDLLVTTVSGETVLVKEGISGEWQWNLHNAGGHMLAVGIYLWYVNGSEAKGKIVIEP
jgi:hypothetical protein